MSPDEFNTCVDCLGPLLVSAHWPESPGNWLFVTFYEYDMTPFPPLKLFPRTQQYPFRLATIN